MTLEAKGYLVAGAHVWQWPLATLRASPEELSIEHAWLGRYSFRPDDVAAIAIVETPARRASGRVQVIHTRADYPGQIGFEVHGPKAMAALLATQIEDAGFSVTAAQSLMPPRQGSALLWWFPSVVALLCSGLLALGSGMGGLQGEPHILHLAAVAVVLGATWALALPDVQSLALRSGRHFGEVRPTVLMVRFYSALVLVALAAARALS